MYEKAKQFMRRYASMKGEQMIFTCLIFSKGSHQTGKCTVSYQWNEMNTQFIQMPRIKRSMSNKKRHAMNNNIENSMMTIVMYNICA